MRSLAANLGCVVRHMTPLPMMNKGVNSKNALRRSSTVVSTEFNSARYVDSILVTSSNYTQNEHRRKTRRHVNFDLALSRCYKNKHNFTPQDSEKMWFDKAELSDIKKEHMDLVRQFFKSRKRAAKEQQETTNGATEKDNGESKEEYWKETFQKVYQECRRSSRGSADAVGRVDRDRLVQLYQRHEQLMGMERYVLYMLRGDINKQVKTLLGSVDQFDFKSEEAFVLQCRAMTLPSMIFVQEIGLAQRAAAMDHDP
eukprot:CAMPEP_0198155810 /NCGR_PEP_ID=MMETSP1443-20131203/69324_1 /TAXON_ID=186043 /ORGANISM="Entomoneis sp., Strain CCMP2396" /LENGTH=255 /DNA_ID=CAMNT_0043822575 /DNA_START=132 /DNA_END=899 /DNA_ORIENTATION=+